MNSPKKFTFQFFYCLKKFSSKMLEKHIVVKSIDPFFQSKIYIIIMYLLINYSFKLRADVKYVIIIIKLQQILLILR